MITIPRYLYLYFNQVLNVYWSFLTQLSLQFIFVHFIISHVRKIHHSNKTLKILTFSECSRHNVQHWHGFWSLAPCRHGSSSWWCPWSTGGCPGRWWRRRACRRWSAGRSSRPGSWARPAAATPPPPGTSAESPGQSEHKCWLQSVS